MYNRPDPPASMKDMGYDTNIFDNLDLRNGVKQEDEVDEKDRVAEDEQKILDRVAEDLARLGRVKRVGLDVQDKIEFVKLWKKRERVRR
jgi:hypothetical protein